MTRPDKDVLKTYAVVGLALILVALVYVRFFHKKTHTGRRAAGPASIGSAIPAGTLRVPDIRLRNAAGETNEVAPRVVLRDIFNPPVPIKPKEPVVIDVEPVEFIPTWVLTGVIRSGNRLIANINNRLVGVGEMIDGFFVVDITPRQVTLRSSKQTVILQLTAPGRGNVTGRSGDPLGL